METPGGSESSAIVSSTRTPTACVSSETMSPVMVAERIPSVRLMVTGPSLTTISASSPRGAEPSGPAMMRLFTACMLLIVIRLPDKTTSVTVSSKLIRVTVSPMIVLTELHADLSRAQTDTRCFSGIDLNRSLVSCLRHVVFDVDDLFQRAERGCQFL